MPKLKNQQKLKKHQVNFSSHIYDYSSLAQNSSGQKEVVVGTAAAKAGESTKILQLAAAQGSALRPYVNYRSLAQEQGY